MLIDVIVPVYNGGAYIRDFAAAFAAQADGDVRFIFVDDGSTDDTQELLRRCAEESGLSSEILQQENAGVSAARNLGLEASEADFVTFFDIDDIPAPDYMETLKTAARTRRFDVFVFPQERIRSGERPSGTNGAEVSFFERTAAEQLRAFWADPAKLGVYDILIAREYLDRTHLRFPDGYKYYEDYDFLSRAFAQAETIVCTERAIYYYVLRGGSAMARFGAERITCLALMRALEDFFAEKAPDFAAGYRRRGVARIYWSVLWQAALAAPSFSDFRRFADRTFAGVYMKMLRGFPDRLVAVSSRAFSVSKRAYFAAVRRLGGRRSNVRPVAREAFDEIVNAPVPDPRRVLVYGMTSNPGGIESYVMGLFRRAPAGTFDFLCDFPTVAYDGELRRKGAAVSFIPAKSRTLVGHWRAIAKVLRAHPEYTSVYFNVLDAGCAFTALIPWLYRRGIVVHSHNDDTEKKRLHRLCRPWLSMMTSGRAACSDAAAAYMFGETGKDVLIVPNAIDAKSFAFDAAVRERKRAELGVEDRFVVCHVGRISLQKNPLGLVDIFAAVREKCPSAVLLSVGEGEMAAAFEERIREKGLDEAVMRLGKRSDIPALLQAADVFLFPSFYEGLGIALLEAQAAGLPCVVSEAVPRQAEATELVRRAPLDAAPERWAEAVLSLRGTGREDTYEQLVSAGYDVSCCEDADRRLMRLFGKE